MSNFFFSHNVFYSIRKLYPHSSIFLTSYLYLLLNWKSPKLAYEVKGYKSLKSWNLFMIVKKNYCGKGRKYFSYIKAASTVHLSILSANFPGVLSTIPNPINFHQYRIFSLGKALTLPKQALVFTCLQYKSFENTVGKGEIAHDEQFLLFLLCFLPI